MSDKPNLPYKIKTIKVIYVLEDGGSDEELDKELTRHFTENYELQDGGAGYLFKTQERDLMFKKTK